ncbi:MAG: epoxyqueuosine reductase [FCB group bacterium]|nr:epoxyqueuosine reductase [FCB group bacterium]
MSIEKTTGQLKDLARHFGASAVGVCRTEKLVERFHPEIRETAKKLPFAVSIGIALQPVVLKTIIDRPNFMYKSHYRATNTQLDNITYRLAQWISDLDHKAMPIPASMVLQRFPMIGHVNHREVAHTAGLGWQGKNNLLINREYGSRLRLTTLLTDLELIADKIEDRDCGQCKACLRKCPTEAIGETPEQFDLQKCRDQVVRFSKENNFGLLICGLCLNCCPPPKKEKTDNGQTTAD